MDSMFYFTARFNQPLNAWDVSSVSCMNSMFKWAEAFSQDLNRWRVIPWAFDKNMFCDSPMEKNPPKWFSKAFEMEGFSQKTKKKTMKEESMTS